MSPPPEANAAPGRRRALAMAAVFGLLSVPWTFGFEQIQGLPLWPSFIASASFFAAGGGPRGLVQSLAGNIVGAVYAAITLLVVAWAGAGAIGLSLVVGVFMLAASLHALVPILGFTPAAFLGFAALFGIHAAGVRLGLATTAGELVATVASMAIGAGLGLLAETLARRTAGGGPTVGTEASR